MFIKGLYLPIALMLFARCDGMLLKDCAGALRKKEKNALKIIVRDFLRYSELALKEKWPEDGSAWVLYQQLYDYGADLLYELESDKVLMKPVVAKKLCLLEENAPFTCHFSWTNCCYDTNPKKMLLE